MAKKFLAPGYDLGGSRLQGVGAPTQATDAASRGFVEALGVSVLAYGAAGDGTTDDTAAINAALASGRVVVLPPGKTYKVSQLHLNALSDVTLIGYGAVIVGSTPASAIVWVQGGSRVRLLGLRLTHNAVARNDSGFGIFLDGCSVASVRDCAISATASAGIYADGVTHGSVQACTVTGTMSDGIHVTGASTQVAVSGCHTSTTGDDGIAVVSYASDTGRCQDVTITGNTVHQSKARGISVVGGSNIAITGNEVRSTKYAGIIIAQETSFSTRGVSGVLVSGNTVADANTYDSPAFQHPSILISAGSATELVSGIHITGNQILGGGYRMLDVDGYSGGLIRGLTIAGNQLLGPNTAGAGIEVARAADVQIIGNSVARTRGSGVYVGYTCDQVQVVDNIVHLPNQGNTTGVYGVYNGAMTGRTSWNSIFPDVTKADLDSDSTATDQSGYAQTLGSIGANQGVFFAGGRAVVLTGENAALAMAQDGQIRWTADGNAGGGTIDTGLARDSAGTVKTTDGAGGVGGLRVTGNLTVDGVGRTIFVRKTADETVNNSSSLQDDNHLVVAVAANAVYTVEVWLIYDAATAADLKVAFTGPTGATLDWTSTALGTAATAGTGSLTVSASTIGDGSAVPLGGVGAGTKVVAQIRGLLITSGTAGNLTTRWAQNTANASDAIVRANSWIRLTRVA